MKKITAYPIAGGNAAKFKLDEFVSEVLYEGQRSVGLTIRQLREQGLIPDISFSIKQTAKYVSLTFYDKSDKTNRMVVVYLENSQKYGRGIIRKIPKEEHERAKSG